MASLLEQAKAAPTSNTRSASAKKLNEVTELAVAFANHEVTSAQAAHALGIARVNVSNRLACRLMTAIRNGEIRLVRKTETKE